MLSARRERRPPRKGAAPRSVDEGDEGLADLRRRSAKAPQHLEVRRAVGGRQDHLNNRRQPLEREFRLWIWLLPGRWCERRLVISEVGSYMLHDLLLLDAAVACPTSSRWRTPVNRTGTDSRVPSLPGRDWHRSGANFFPIYSASRRFASGPAAISLRKVVYLRGGGAGLRRAVGRQFFCMAAPLSARHIRGWKRLAAACDGRW